MARTTSVDHVCHPAAVRGWKADSVIGCMLGRGLEGVVERLHARRLGRGSYEVCNVPYFAYDLSLGDVVRVQPDRTLPWIERVVRPSEALTLRVKSDSWSSLRRVVAHAPEEDLVCEWHGVESVLLALSANGVEEATNLANRLNRFSNIAWEQGWTDEGTFENYLGRKRRAARKGR